MESKGLVMGLMMGVAALVITTMIAFVIVQNVATVDDSIATSLSKNIYNDTSSGILGINATSYTVSKSTESGFAEFTVHELWNGTTLIAAGNYTVDATAGTVVGSAGRTANYTGITILTYEYTWTPTEGTGDRMITNFTKGVGNVSKQIPTILLIAAVVLVLGILALLWQQYQKMDIGGGGEL